MSKGVGDIALLKLLLICIIVVPLVSFGLEETPMSVLLYGQEPAPMSASPGSGSGSGSGLLNTYNKLLESGFQNVSMNAGVESGQLNVELYHSRISEADRLIGRAVRIIDGFAPDEFSSLEVCFLDGGTLCSVCYDIDRRKLSRYFSRLLSSWQLRLYVTKHECKKGLNAKQESIAGDSINGTEGGVSYHETAHPLTFNSDKHIKADKRHLDYDLLAGFNLYQSNRFQVVGRPVDFGRYLNDADGDIFLDVQSSILLDAYLPAGWGLHGDAFYRWVSSSESGSDSELPHVRSDIDLYRDKSGIKLDSLFVSYRSQVGRSGLFAAALGYQEEMFAGLSTQLYFPEVMRHLNVDLTVDYLRQREINESLSLMNYDVTSALLGVSWSGAPYFNDVKLYVGRFLAKDSGARLDLGHRFNNGMRLSFWYSHTDIDDSTGPGSSSSPYRGRGVTFSIPLGGLRSRDSQRVYDFEYVPHLRDTAQMLERPIDLSNSISQRALKDSELRQFGQ